MDIFFSSEFNESYQNVLERSASEIWVCWVYWSLAKLTPGGGSWLCREREWPYLSVVATAQRETTSKRLVPRLPHP